MFVDLSLGISTVAGHRVGSSGQTWMWQAASEDRALKMRITILANFRVIRPFLWSQTHEVSKPLVTNLNDNVMALNPVLDVLHHSPNLSASAYAG